ncbi:hypothetical protein [Yinghuangia seranimata]|uniref:hypothetical protein n=1 Tax=Yinghuangia seranimata TaxID=408067 RepID=UPI00248CD718|nr:hypothetical protein [Yinghuangia seranimata]MDI2129962.1 hypothetical protein [Yinghuangia seranimata]MDI2131640.1 hypothetical protein [Yinghuangia seranimata]
MTSPSMLLEAAPEAMRPRLFDRLGPALQTAVLGDFRTPDAVVSAHVAANGTREQQAALGRNRRAHPDTIYALAAKADVQVAVAVLSNPYAPREAHKAAARVVPQYLIPRKGEPSGPYSPTKRLMLAIECDDPDLTVAALAVLPFPGAKRTSPAIALRGCLGLRRIVGPDVARGATARFLTRPIPEPVRVVLADPTDLRRLERTYERSCGTQGFIRMLRGRRKVTQDVLERWPHTPLDWSQIMDADRAEPFQREAVTYLSRQAGCPDLIRDRREGRPDDQEARTHLAGLTAARLGDDIEAWAVALALAGDFAGTTPELLDTAVAVVGGRAAPY